MTENDKLGARPASTPRMGKLVSPPRRVLPAASRLAAVDRNQSIGRRGRGARFAHISFFVTGVVALGFTIALAAQAQVSEKSEMSTPGKPTPANPNAKADPQAIKEADEAQKLVQKREELLLGLLKEIDQHIRGIEPGSLQKERLALDGFKKLTPQLRQQAQWLLDKQPDFSKNLQLYKAALDKMPPALLRAADAYAKFAADEEDDFFKEHYLEMNFRARRLGEVMAVRARAMEATHGEVLKRIRFVEKSIVFLNRLEDFLAIYDPAVGKSAEVAAYIQQLDSYIAHFHRSIRAFKDLAGRIQSGPSIDAAQKETKSAKTR